MWASCLLVALHFTLFHWMLGFFSPSYIFSQISPPLISHFHGHGYPISVRLLMLV
jgi:hypothetical protein